MSRRFEKFGEDGFEVCLDYLEMVEQGMNSTFRATDGRRNYLVKESLVGEIGNELSAYQVLDKVFEEDYSVFLSEADEAVAFYERENTDSLRAYLDAYRGTGRRVCEKINLESLYGAVASKYLLGDWDAKPDNLLVEKDTGKVLPIDFEYSGEFDDGRFWENVGNTYRRVGLKLDKNRVKKRSKELSKRLQESFSGREISGFELRI